MARYAVPKCSQTHRLSWQQWYLRHKTTQQVNVVVAKYSGQPLSSSNASPRMKACKRFPMTKEPADLASSKFQRTNAHTHTHARTHAYDKRLHDSAAAANAGAAVAMEERNWK